MTAFNFSKAVISERDKIVLHDGFFLLPSCGSFTYYVLICEKGRLFADWQGLHESKEMLLLAAAEIVVPRIQRIRLKDFQSLNDLSCP